MVPWLVAFLVGVVGGIALHGILRRRKERRIAERRVVEAPNSAHTSELARLRSRAERWRQIALVRLHPLNRREVEHLLGIVATHGATALGERERAFLDAFTDGSDR